MKCKTNPVIEVVEICKVFIKICWCIYYTGRNSLPIKFRDAGNLGVSLRQKVPRICCAKEKEFEKKCGDKCDKPDDCEILNSISGTSCPKI